MHDVIAATTAIRYVTTTLVSCYYATYADTYLLLDDVETKEHGFLWLAMSLCFLRCALPRYIAVTFICSRHVIFFRRPILVTGTDIYVSAAHFHAFFFAFLSDDGRYFDIYRLHCHYCHGFRVTGLRQAMPRYSRHMMSYERCLFGFRRAEWLLLSRFIISYLYATPPPYYCHKICYLLR